MGERLSPLVCCLLEIKHIGVDWAFAPLPVDSVSPPPSPCLDLGAINMGELLRAPQPTNALPPPPTYQLAPLKVLLKVDRIFLLIRSGTAKCAVCAVSVPSNRTR